MYAWGMALLLGGIPRGWPGGTWAWLSSGDSTVLSSTPLASPLEGSGAFKQACGGRERPTVSNATGWRGDAIAAYLNEVLALGLCHEGLQLGCGEGVDKASLRHDEKQHLCAC
jgi:hypothetical protein